MNNVKLTYQLFDRRIWMGAGNERLAQLRDEIDSIDAELAALFERRMAVVSEVAAFKRKAGLPVYDASREDSVVARGRARVSPENADDMENLLIKLMQISKERQEELTIDTT